MDEIVGVGGAMGDATKLDLAAWDRDLRINVTSMVLMARHAIPEMRKNGRGAIVNIASVSGRKSTSSDFFPPKACLDNSDYHSIGWQPEPALPYH